MTSIVSNILVSFFFFFSFPSSPCARLVPPDPVDAYPSARFLVGSRLDHPRPPPGMCTCRRELQCRANLASFLTFSGCFDAPR